MKKIRLVVISATIFILSILITNTVFASPPFTTSSQVQQLIDTAVAPIQSAVENLIGKVGTIETNVATQSANITDLQQRVTDLENQQPPEPFDFTFFNGSVSTAGEVSPIADVQGYTKVSFTYKCTVGEVALHLQVSPDGILWFTQKRFDPTQCKGGGSETLNTAGRFYRVTNGSTTNPALSINAFGHFFN